MPKHAGTPGRRIEKIRGDNRYMSFLAELREIVVRGMEVEVITVSELAKEAGLSESTVRNFLKGDSLAPQLPTVHWILGAVYVSITTDSPHPRRKRHRR